MNSNRVLAASPLQGVGRLWLCGLVALAFALTASIGQAASREAMLGVLEDVATGHPAEDLRVWANDGSNVPVEEGTPVSFHFESKDDLHLTALYLDADGNLVLLYPAPSGTTLRSNAPMTLEAGEATTPYGQESLFVVGTREPITRGALGIDSMDPVTVIPADQAQQTLENLRTLLAQQGGESARVDLHIVPTQRTGQGLTRGGIVQYFTEATRSLHRPKLALDIRFETNSAELLDDARSDLDVVGRALADDRLDDKQFRLVGHTDHRGDDTYNLSLSEQRARAAREYLMQNHGISEERLDALGLGESEPMIPGTDERALSRNRRVELELVR